GSLRPLPPPIHSCPPQDVGRATHLPAPFAAVHQSVPGMIHERAGKRSATALPTDPLSHRHGCAGDFESYRASHAVGLYHERRERLDPTRITLPNIVQLLNGCV